LALEAVQVSDAKTGKGLSRAQIGYVIASKHGSPTPSDVIGFWRKSVQNWKDLLATHGLKT
jgi:hypothetical protein